MRTPSLEDLWKCFSDPVEAKRILTMSGLELREHPVGRARIAECYGPPQYDVRMHVLNSLDYWFHGVESIETMVGGEYAWYLNTGDMYAPTLIYWCGSYRVQSVGDFIERSRVKFK